jgi:hypothetical protein
VGEGVQGVDPRLDMLVGDFATTPDNPDVDALTQLAVQNNFLDEAAQQRLLVRPVHAGLLPHGGQLWAEGKELVAFLRTQRICLAACGTVQGQCLLGLP